VVPQIESSVAPGGVYVGVGPEQNFTFIAAAHPRLAFVVDIQRGILIEHLLYKATFDLSRTRKEFVERLFSRLLPAGSAGASANDLMNAVPAASADGPAFERNLAEVLDTLQTKYAVHLDAADTSSLRSIYQLFGTLGPRIDWASTMHVGAVMASYQQLMGQHDGAGHELSFLSSEPRYALVRDMEIRNLIVPLVGNFAGPKTIRGIGDFLRTRGDAVSAFYVSNVEEYLTRDQHRSADNGQWSAFCANVATWPLALDARFIRPYGRAEYDGSGTLSLNPDVAADDRRSTSYPQGERHEMPAALFPIAPEVQACR
jgi:hypothetical protein